MELQKNRPNLATKKQQKYNYAVKKLLKWLLVGVKRLKGSASGFLFQTWPCLIPGANCIDITRFSKFIKLHLRALSCVYVIVPNNVWKVRTEWKMTLLTGKHRSAFHNKFSCQGCLPLRFPWCPGAGWVLFSFFWKLVLLLDSTSQ